MLFRSNVNRIAWKTLEEEVRTMDTKTVLTGAIYQQGDLKIGKHGVPVPVFLYKVVYLKDGSIKVFEASNTKENKKIEEISLQTLENQVAIKFN